MKKIPYVKHSNEIEPKKIMLIPMSQARLGAIIYFIIGLIIGGILF